MTEEVILPFRMSIYKDDVFVYKVKIQLTFNQASDVEWMMERAQTFGNYYRAMLEKNSPNTDIKVVTLLEFTS